MSVEIQLEINDTYFVITGVQETPKAGTGISSSGRDASVVAGIVVAVISGILILVGLVSKYFLIFTCLTFYFPQK